MDLSQYLKELLHTHDCVILPRIGGFVAHYKPASIDFVAHRLYPARKVLSFNHKLNGDDAFLAQNIAQTQHIALPDALQQVEHFITYVEHELLSNQYIHLRHIGHLSFNAQHELEFVPEETNFLLESFALEPVECYPVLRHKSPVRPTTPTHPQLANPELLGVAMMSNQNATAKSKKGLFIPLLVLALVLVIPIVIYMMRRDTPAPLSPPALTLDTPAPPPVVLDTLVTTTTPPAVPDTTATSPPAASDTLPAIAATGNPSGFNPTIIPTTNAGGDSDGYIIILGAFREPKNARRLIKNLEKDGYFTHTDQTNSGLQRVGVRLSCSSQELQQHLRDFRHKFTSKAWVL